ncbi:MAG: hypothetical protein IJQ79_02205, partial [Bacteroidales bacterium]|nr:hypothetical protein [Bacteroidales bacterium]
MADLEIVKISELPEAASFANLYTIGTDALLRSVKVSLAALASVPGLSSSVSQISGTITQLSSQLSTLASNIGSLSSLNTQA